MVASSALVRQTFMSHYMSVESNSTENSKGQYPEFLA